MPPRRVVHKRANSTKETTQVTPKRAKRMVPSPKGGANSKASKKQDPNDDENGSIASSSESDDLSSNYEDEEATEPDSEEPEDEDEDSDEPRSSKRRSMAGRPKKSSERIVPRAKDLLKPGVKTGLGPGTQVVMKKPKARTAGKTPYTDDTIHPNTMLFLGDLAANNNREWLKMNDPDYRTSLKDFNSFIEKLSEKLIEIDDTVPELPMKDIVFKIYRDVRFSKDPTPYKTAFAASWSRTGRKGPFAKYYFHIKPGGSVIAAGLWMPEASQLATLRRAIDRRSQRLKETLLDAELRKEFLGGVTADEKKAVKKFIEANKENALKTKPKGFDADHKDLELLRLRSFTVHRNLSDDEVLGPQGIQKVAQLIHVLVPFVTYLNSVVMPDDEDDEDDEDEDGSEKDEGDEAAGEESDQEE